MFADNRDLFSRYGSSRAGRILVAVSKAALPVTVVSTSVIAQEKKGIPLLDEFILRAIRLGQGRIRRIAQLSGVADSLIQSSAAGLAASGNLIYGVQDGVLALTPFGEKMAIDMATIKPVQRQFKVCFDRTLWCVAGYDSNELISKGQARDADQLILPAIKSSRIGDRDIAVSNLNALIRKGNIGSSEIDILRITKLSGNTHRYLPVGILIYVDSVNSDLELALIVDEDLSQSHELPLISLDVAKRLGIEVSRDVLRPKLSDELEVAREARRSSPEINSGTSSLSQVARVLGFEHRALLEDGLSVTNRRLLIATGDVDVEFFKSYALPKIADLLKAGVTVKLAFNRPQKSAATDKDPLGLLSKLSARYPASLSVDLDHEYTSNTLIFDDSWVETSFGWLDDVPHSPQPLMLHEGTLVQGREYSDAKFNELTEFLF
ncbi:hypothetical protein AAFM46_02415 [Arthrobacter sp. TMP15]|uniref:hypothetical protein n=1 Tax=Arthrobacter sp. TMP15 TaxID=3140789 RepID=UPI0031BA5DCF